MSETSEKITTAAPLADLIDARLSRRSALKGLFAAGVATVAAPAALAATRSGDPSSLPFAQAPHTIEMFHQVAPGHRADVLIRRLRGKMEQDPRDPQLFVTVHGEGYLFAGELAA